MFIDFRVRGRTGERWRQRETSINCLPYVPHLGIWGLNPQPWYVPWLEIETCNLLVYRMMLQPTDPPGQGLPPLLKSKHGSFRMLPSHSIFSCITSVLCGVSTPRNTSRNCGMDGNPFCFVVLVQPWARHCSSGPLFLHGSNKVSSDIPRDQIYQAKIWMTSNVLMMFQPRHHSHCHRCCQSNSAKLRRVSSQ